MRIVIDTNVVASGIVFGGKPERILKLAIRNDVEMCISPQILAKYDEIIARLSAKYPNYKNRQLHCDSSLRCETAFSTTPEFDNSLVAEN